MSLVEDLEAWYAGNSYPPEGNENCFNGEAEQVAYEIIDSAARWGNSIQVVYRRGDELVAVSDIEPATEEQSWGDYGSPEIYPVVAKEVVRVEYVKA